MPASADRIPDNVLASPIIGEARRFDGMVAPAGWILTQGQSLKIAENPRLFSVLGTTAGGDGKQTFRLAKPAAGYVIAVAGMFASSPTLLAQSGRRLRDHADSLGPGAIVRVIIPKVDAARAKTISDSQRMRLAALRAGPGIFERTPPELLARYTESRFASRDVALGILSASNRAVFDGAMEQLASGGAALNDAVTRMTPLLSEPEASALLEANDARYRAFRSEWRGTAHENPQLEAARFLVSVGLSADQQRRFSARQQQP